jgi:hypothetical protein
MELWEYKLWKLVTLFVIVFLLAAFNLVPGAEWSGKQKDEEP